MSEFSLTMASRDEERNETDDAKSMDKGNKIGSWGELWDALNPCGVWQIVVLLVASFTSRWR